MLKWPHKLLTVGFGISIWGMSYAHAQMAPASAVQALPELNPQEATVAASVVAVPNSLVSYEAHHQADLTSINLRFAKDVSPFDIVIEDHTTFIQINLPNLTVTEPGKFVDAQSDYISKLVAFQPEAARGSFRFFVNHEASLVRQALTSQIAGNLIIINLDHKKIEELLKNDPSVTAQTQSMPTAAEIIQKTDIEKDIPPPAEMVKASVAKIAVEEPAIKAGKKAKKAEAFSPLVLKDSSKLEKNLVNTTIFCAVMLCGLLALYVMRTRVRRKSPSENFDTVTIRSLSKHVINPKQRLELIEIGGEKLLIGIGPEQINLISHIGQKPAMVAPSLTQPIRVGATKAQPTKALPKATAEKKSTIEASVGDEIAINYKPQEKQRKPTQAINDVTQLIREKLRNLPSI